MKDKETTSPPNPSLESEGDDDLFPSSGFEIQKVESELDGRTQVIEDSRHVPKQVHQFYFVKLWPTEPDSISQIKKEERVVKKMNQDLLEITEKIKEKMSERDHLSYRLKYLNYYYRGWRSSVARKGMILNNLYVALDELCFVSNAPKRRSNKTCFTGELDNHKLNFVMLHGSKSLADEKQILRDINTQRRDAASFKSIEVLRNTINWSYYMSHCQKLLREIEQFQIQRENAAGNASVKGENSNYVSLKKAVKDQIKLFCDDSLENRREEIAHGTRIRRAEKELEAINKVIHSLRTKLSEKHQKKDEAYHSILKLKTLYDGEITHYYHYRSLINKAHQLAEEKNVTALDKLSRSKVSKFMFQWNNSTALREDYVKKVLQSLDRRQLSRDGRMSQNKSCSAILL